MIFDEKKECMRRDEIREVQNKNLILTVKNVYENVPYYRRKLDDAGVEVSEFRGLEDLNKLPFTTKEDLRINYPYGLFSVPMKEIERLHASSGTTGKPVVVGYTKKDLETWKEVIERALIAYGVKKEDFVHISYGYGLFSGGLGIHGGVEKLGATVIPVSVGNTEKQINMLQDLESSVIACTPSYALHLADVLDKKDIDKRRIKLKIGIFGGEPWTNEMRNELERRLNIKAFDIYGLSEIIGPGVSFECEEMDGLHINEDYFLPEIIDPDTLETLPEGERGELVITTITKEGMPLIRYRTRDITRLNYEKCKCGRTFVRMDKCLTRTDDMLVIRGVNVYPTQVESILLKYDGITSNFLLIVDRIDNLDILEIVVEAKEELLERSNSYGKQIYNDLKKEIQSILGLDVKLKIVEPNTLERNTNKVKRIVDKRKALQVSGC